MFYETIDGLNFKCFNNLFKQEPSYVFFNSDTIGADPKTDEFTQGTFITEKVVFRDSSNRVKQYENGAFSSRTYFHDLTTKQWGARNFSYINENLVNEKSGSPNTLNTNLNAPLARAIATAQNIDNTMFPVVSRNQVENYSPQKIFFAPRHTNVQGEDFGTNENNYETLPRVKSNMSLYNDTEVEITVSGNSLLRAGQVVTFMVARNEPVDKIKSSASEFNEEKSGKYVISSVHHRFFLQDGSYKTYLNLVRNFRGLYRAKSTKPCEFGGSNMMTQMYQGVVEDRNDPLSLGRVRIRFVGLHSEDKLKIKTEDLPWAYPVQPITSAAMNGIGTSPLGPVEGTWVVGFFRDQNMQQPVYFGTLGGVPQEVADPQQGFNDPNGRYPLLNHTLESQTRTDSLADKKKARLLKSKRKC